MSNGHDAAGSQFETKALRALGIGGIVVALWQAAYLAFLIIGWGLFNRTIAPGLTELNNAAVLMICASPVLLLIGCIGVLRMQRWGRILLLVYAFIALGVHILTFFVEAYEYLQWSTGQDSPQQIGQYFCMLLDNRISSSVLPIVIIVLFLYLRVLRNGAPTGAFELIPVSHRRDSAT